MGTTIKLILTAIGGFLSYWLGGLDAILICLTALVVIDYISGILQAIYNKNLNSEIGFRGIIKKVFIYIVIAVAFIIEKATNGMFAIREVVIMFFIVNESLSILENVGKTGVNLPKALIKILEQLKSKGDE